MKSQTQVPTIDKLLL